MAAKKDGTALEPIAEEEVMKVPVEWLASTQGCAFDIGTVTTRVLYQPRSQLQQWKMKFEGAKFGKIRMFTLPTRDLNEALTYLSHNANVKPEEEVNGTPEEDEQAEQTEQVIYVTGPLASQHKDRIADLLNARAEIVDTNESLVAGFKVMLERLPKSEMVYDPLTEAAEEGKKQAVEFRKPGSYQQPEPAQKKMAAMMVPKPVEKPYAEEDRHILPCVLAIMEQDTKYLKIDKDGSFEELIEENVGGAHAAGLSALVLKTKSFAETIKLASSGDASNIHIMGRDVNNGGERVPENMVVQSFGKVANQDPGKFKKEDIAAALVDDVSFRIAYAIGNAAAFNYVTKMFFTGEMSEHELVRRSLTKWLGFGGALAESSPEYFFLRDSSYFRVIGAYTHHLKK